MKTIIVGGTFGNKDESKTSKIIDVLSNTIEADKLVNGGSVDDLKKISNSLQGYDLVIWMANIDNRYNKIYPHKDEGSIMIVSKVLHDDLTEVDAVSRIFRMRANAVISIKKEPKLFNFKLIDALGNVWKQSYAIADIGQHILKLYEWTRSSIRIGVKEVDNVDKFIELNKQVADKFELIKERYFGNISTRCSLMFPSTRYEDTHILVSRRNSSKARLTREDMVLTKFDHTNGLKVAYIGENKPSVDTPIQLSLFEKYPNINYIIHGHSYIEDAEMTESYFPCGDMREYKELKNIIKICDEYGKINLKNHGFLIYSKSIDQMEKLVNGLVFIERKIGKEQIE